MEVNEVFEKVKNLFVEELGLDEFEIEQEIENYNQTDRE